MELLIKNYVNTSSTHGDGLHKIYKIYTPPMNDPYHHHVEKSIEEIKQWVKKHYKKKKKLKHK